jgi:hypothetical protein
MGVVKRLAEIGRIEPFTAAWALLQIAGISLLSACRLIADVFAALDHSGLAGSQHFFNRRRRTTDLLNRCPQNVRRHAELLASVADHIISLRLIRLRSCWPFNVRSSAMAGCSWRSLRENVRRAGLFGLVRHFAQPSRFL